ncbi:hypothetical protein JXL21_04075 [Candidatus Bathyarchaeota archaeon]|nr:hypothetical protein [Candidatus Bathyarchaeota archaeon]
MDSQPTLQDIYEEVVKTNKRLSLIESILEEVIVKGLPKEELTEKELDEIKASIEEMKKGDYVSLEALRRA